MEACFNDLSIKPLAVNTDEAEVRINKYADVIKSAVTNYGFKKIRYATRLDSIQLSESETIASYCYKNQRNLKVQLLLSTQRCPYIGEQDNEDLQHRYVEYYASLSDTGESAEGFLMAYIMNTICVGFLSCDKWFNLEHNINISENGIEKQINWICVSEVTQFQLRQYRKWYDNNSPLSLIKSGLDPQKKSIHLRDDHGKDILKQHADCLKQSPYVIKVINSLPYNPNAQNYIHKVKSDGKIEIVLTDTDKGLGLVIQTTGRNMRETQEIANVLLGKYGR